MSIIQYETREDWVAGRGGGLGASEAPAAIGASPYATPFSLWALKTGLLPQEDLAAHKEAVRWGTLLEPAIIQEFGVRTGREVVPHDQCQMVVHPSLSFLRATPDATQFDRQQRDDPGDLQIKTAGHFVASDWAFDQTPIHVQVQVQCELAVTGMQWGTVCCLLAGQKMVWRDVQRDDEFIAALLPALEKFWQHVVDRTAPDVDDSEVTARVLAKMHPLDNGETVELPHESVQWALDLDGANAKIKELEALKTHAQNRFRAAIGDATFAVLPDGSKYSYKTQERAAHEVKASQFRVLRKASKK